MLINIGSKYQAKRAYGSGKKATLTDRVPRKFLSTANNLRFGIVAILVTAGWQHEGFHGIRKVSWWTSGFWKKQGEGIQR